MKPLATLLSLLVAFMLVAPVVAQPATPARPPEDAPVGVLAEFSLDSLPTPHTEIWFIRYGFGPGSSVPAARQIGPVVLVIESGSLTIGTDQPVQVAGGVPATPAAAAATPAGAMIETELTASQAVLIPDGTTLEARNDGDVTATVLTLNMYAAEREGESEDGGEPRGALEVSPLSIMAAELPEGPGTVVIERVAADPGSAIDVDLSGGAEVGFLEDGEATLAVESGEAIVWPQIGSVAGGDTQGPDREQVRRGSQRLLVAGDGYGLADVSGTWTIDGGDGATILLARVTPAGGDS